MLSIFNSIKGLITPELIKQASASLGEDQSKVTSAITSLVPTLLGSVLARGNSPSVESALKEAGQNDSSILSNITNLFSGKMDDATSKRNDGFLGALFGDKLDGVSSLISSTSGLSSGSSNKLISMITPIVAGFLGNKMLSGKLGLSGLLDLLNSEKNSFASFIPSGFSNLLGLASLKNDLSAKASSVADMASKEVKKGGSFLKWLLPLLILIALLFFVWKSCGKSKHDISNSATTSTTSSITMNQDSQVNTNKPVLTDKVATELTLPNGLKINAFKGGIEDQLLAFMNSDEYKNASDDDLKNKWFSFDNVEFKFGSGTDLTPESYKQIDNIIVILKANPNVKIKVGGYTDKKGNAEANLKISQERADTIKNILTKGGVGSQIDSAEGYGDKHAVYPADAKEEDRATDRKLAVRLVK